MPVRTKPAVAVVSIPGRRAFLFDAGGISYERYVRGPGWIVDDEPSEMIERYAEHLLAFHLARETE